MLPLEVMVVAPVMAPAVVTFRPAEVSEKVPVALPSEVLAVPLVLMLVAPTTVRPALPVRRPLKVGLLFTARLLQLPPAPRVIVPPPPVRLVPAVGQVIWVLPSTELPALEP